MDATGKQKRSYGGKRAAVTLEGWRRRHRDQLQRMDRIHLTATAAVRAFLGLEAPNLGALAETQNGLQIRGDARC